MALDLAAGVFLGLAGAFGTDEAPVAVRLAYWIGLCLIGSGAGTAVTAAATRVGGLGARRWLLAVFVFACLTALLTPTVWAITETVFGFGRTLSHLPSYIPPVVIITAAMTALTFLLNRAPVLTHVAPPPPPATAGAEAPPPPPARFLDRLPPKLRGATLHAVESEDHYLRLHTSRGSDLILFRLGDAIGELEGLEGSQTHRSWWVARAAVAEARRGDGRAELVLKDGTEAPVSRTFAPALRQAGWF